MMRMERVCWMASPTRERVLKQAPGVMMNRGSLVYVVHGVAKKCIRTELPELNISLSIHQLMNFDDSTFHYE